MTIYRAVNQQLGSTPCLQDRWESYLGPIISRRSNLYVQYQANECWSYQHHPIIPSSVGPIFLPPDFDQIHNGLIEKPLKKYGMKVHPQENLQFLMAELENWVHGPHKDSQALYPSMWAGVPNTEKYSLTASRQVSTLIDRARSLFDHQLNSASRSVELRFPQDYCPICWSVTLSQDLKTLDASLMFRSVETSRNLLNDLYLFCGYFGHILSKAVGDRVIFIKNWNFYALDAHLVDFGD